MKVLLTMDGRTDQGGGPLIMHNDRLADPLDEYTRAIAKISKKRKKTDAEHQEIARLEFLGGLYTNSNGPCLPAINILRCLQDGGKRTKRGQDVLCGVVPLVAYVDLAYEGQRDPDALWRAGGYALRKSVGVMTSRTMRTRPLFTDWSAVLPVEVDPTVFDSDTLAGIWRDAGIYAGLGDMRPIYGKFRGTLTEWTITSTDGLSEAAYALACAVAARRIQMSDEEHNQRHGFVQDLLHAEQERAASLHAKREAMMGAKA